MSVREWMRFRSSGNRIEQDLEAVFRLHAPEMRAMGTKFAKQRFVRLGYALSDHCNSQPRRWRRLGRHCSMESIRVLSRRLPKMIELVRRPKVGGQLFNKLSWRVYPIK